MIGKICRILRLRERTEPADEPMRKSKPRRSSPATVRTGAASDSQRVRPGVCTTAGRASTTAERGPDPRRNAAPQAGSGQRAGLQQEQPLQEREPARADRPAGHAAIEVAQASTSVGGSDDWRRMVDRLPIGAVSFAAGEVHMNRAAELLTGYDRDELSTEEAWFTKLYGRRAPRILKRHQKGWREGFPEPATVTIRRKDGTKRAFEFRAARYDDAAIAVMQDVTESQELQRQVLDLVNDEQRVVGQELHDTVLQDLAGLGLLAATLAEQLPRESAARQRADKLSAGLARANQTVHQLAEGLVPLAIDAGDLQSALELLVARTRESSGLSCRLSCDPGVSIDDKTAHELYRVAQEAVSNIVRHARARSVTIGLHEHDGIITLEVLDDGIGVDDQATPAAGLGRQIMKYRCNLIGGTCSIARRAEGGTRVRCMVPHHAAGDAP